MFLTKEASSFFFWEGYSRLWDWLKQASHHFIISFFSSPFLYTSGFPVHGISQARILEWAAISFSRGSSPPREQTRVSCIAGRFFSTESPGKPQGYCTHSLKLSFPRWDNAVLLSQCPCEMGTDAIYLISHSEGQVWFCMWRAYHSAWSQW